MPDLNFKPTYDFLEKLSNGDEDTIKQAEENLKNNSKLFEEEFLKFEVNSVKKKIKSEMQWLWMRNKKYSYTFVFNDEKVIEKTIKSLDAYIISYFLSKHGDVKCYRMLNNITETEPIFTIIDGTMRLKGRVIK